MGLIQNIGSIILAIFIFGLLIFVHELGHFIAAKKSGVRVNEFAIGMGPTLWKKKKGDTTYALRLLPIGGFVAMEGEEKSSDDIKSFNNATYFKKAIIMLSGVTMNAILGFVLVSIVIFSTFYAKNSEGKTLPTDVVQKIVSVDALGNQNEVENAIKAGDKIIKIDGYGSPSTIDIRFLMAVSDNRKVDLTVLRDGKKLDLGVIDLGDKFIVQGEKERTFLGVVGYSADYTTFLVRQVWWSITQLGKGGVEVTDFSGPIGITQAVSETVKQKNGRDLIMFIAMLSVNLAVVNLLPLPILDGGRLVILTIEKIIGKPLSPKIQSIVTLIGIMLLLFLMISATYGDVTRLIKGV